MRPNAFPGTRRLKRRRLIRPLFDRARPDVGRVRVGTVQILYRAVDAAATGVPGGIPLQVLFAPGRRARTGAGRTRLRRLMREAFRTGAHGLLAHLDGRADTLTLAVLFQGREATAADEIPRDLPAALDRLARRAIPPPRPDGADARPAD